MKGVAEENGAVLLELFIKDGQKMICSIWQRLLSTTDRAIGPASGIVLLPTARASKEGTPLKATRRRLHQELMANSAGEALPRSVVTPGICKCLKEVTRVNGVEDLEPRLQG
jgi:hypothetical protein